MKSKVMIDIDYDEKSILRIKYVESDDLRDKSVRSFINKLHGAGACFLKIEKQSVREIGKEPAYTEMILKTYNQDEYVDDRFFKGSSGETNAIWKSTDWMGGLREDEKENYIKQCSPSNEPSIIPDLPEDGPFSKHYVNIRQIEAIIQTYIQIHNADYIVYAVSGDCIWIYLDEDKVSGNHMNDVRLLRDDLIKLDVKDLTNKLILELNAVAARKKRNFKK
jgi:hypothetical protein